MSIPWGSLPVGAFDAVVFGGDGNYCLARVADVGSITYHDASWNLVATVTVDPAATDDQLEQAAFDDHWQQYPR